MKRGRIWAGVAKVDITPDISRIRIQLGGYNARLNMPPQGVHDPIYARALALEWGKQRAVIVSIDHLLVPGSLTRAVLTATGLTPEQLFLSATHTHSAPDSMGLNERMRFPLPGVGTFVPEFLQFTAERVAQAVREAFRGLKPAVLAIVAQPVPKLNRNRRGRPVVDPTMTVLRVDTERGTPIGAVVVYAAHPTIYSHTMMEVSADFPGVVQSQLERALGQGAIALFLNGALGDVSPVADEGNTPHERVQRYGSRLAIHALRLLRTAQRMPAFLNACQIQVRLPEARPHPAFYETAGREYKVPQSLLQQLVKQLMPETAPVSALRVGELVLVGFPGEPTSILGLRTREVGRELGLRYATPVALTNEWIGYILTPREYHTGSYEATISFNGPEAGEVIMQGVRAALQAIVGG
ncbi:MAG: neutral/alkaline non-lysosomal ceramidase N-terminal domain-containing protein [Armatimonadota bacterium]|nr:neutral/alkaline non-lysosomal ceramidase N-terminal domain-containing protein [Armatimonadota bacterium]